jgi:hypothetical protein
LGIWVTLTLGSHLSLPKLQYFGDYTVIIDWLNDRGNLKACAIEGWKIHTKALIKNFQAISFHHIFRDFNKEADQLSKAALLVPEGNISYYRWEPGGASPMNHLAMFWSLFFFLCWAR